MLADFIRKRMAELGLRQADLAARSQLSRQYISDLVGGKRGSRLSSSSQQKLARALKVPTKHIADSVAVANFSVAIADKATNAHA